MKKISIEGLLLHAEKISGLIEKLYKEHPEIKDMTIRDYFREYSHLSDTEIETEVYCCGYFRFYALSSILKTAMDLDSTMFAKDIEDSIRIIKNIKKQLIIDSDDLGMLKKTSQDLLLITRDCTFWCIILGSALGLDESEYKDAISTIDFLINPDIKPQEEKTPEKPKKNIYEEAEFEWKEFPGTLGVDFDVAIITYSV